MFTSNFEKLCNEYNENKRHIEELEATNDEIKKKIHAEIKKKIHAFIWNNIHNPYETDLYYNPESHKFIEYSNVWGNSWLAGEDIYLFSVDGSNFDFSSGSTREWIDFKTEEKYFETLNKLYSLSKTEEV